MKQFFEAYDGDEELSMQLRELPWSANLHLLSKCKSRQERVFYLQWMQQEGWTVRQLAQQIDGALFELDEQERERKASEGFAQGGLTGEGGGDE